MLTTSKNKNSKLQSLKFFSEGNLNNDQSKADNDSKKSEDFENHKDSPSSRPT